ncbi:MAG: metallophosphoesterase [Bacteroidales bacterium]|nr:metallophosphoesterase [Bacteroidales bacterium]
MRILFYTFIIVICVLPFVLFGQVVYWTSRIFVERHTAAVIHWITMGVIILIVATAAIWGNLVTRHQLQVTQTNIVSPRIPASFDGLRIAQISDMHLDWFDSVPGHAFYDKLITAIGEQQPDLIVFTGDLVTTQACEAEPFRDVLHRLAHIPARDGNGFIPIYSILGNHDYADYTHKSPREKVIDLHQLCDMQTESGWTLFRNEGILIGTDGRPVADSLAQADNCIALMGVENIGEPPFSTYGDLSRAMRCVESAPAETFSILLSHNPTHWRSEILPRTGIDLTLSGHTHATQFKIGSWSPSKWKYPEWSGLYEASARTTDDGSVLKSTTPEHPQFIYVNTGIGGVGPRVRIGVEPELTILTLCSRE